jgi:hypothetical protein
MVVDHPARLAGRDPVEERQGADSGLDPVRGEDRRRAALWPGVTEPGAWVSISILHIKATNPAEPQGPSRQPVASADRVPPRLTSPTR